MFYYLKNIFDPSTGDSNSTPFSVILHNFDNETYGIQNLFKNKFFFINIIGIFNNYLYR